MENIRQAKNDDISRICEILVFVKRINFLPIFKDTDYSFNELQVIKLANSFNDELIKEYFVYDDGVVKGFVHIKNEEVKELYVDSFFQGGQIGKKLLIYAVQNYDVRYLWALEKNTRAIKFYNNNGFIFNGEKKYEEGTSEYLLKLVYNE